VGWDEEINHAVISEAIAKKYLIEINYDSNKMELVLEAVKNHNIRDDENPVSLESKIVMDADILDEVGAISILWDAMAAHKNGCKDYSEVYDRIKHYYGRLKVHAQLLKTETGKRLYRERLRFISQFIDELEYELFLPD
jgi:uncharacterized protein